MFVKSVHFLRKQIFCSADYVCFECRRKGLTSACPVARKKVGLWDIPMTRDQDTQGGRQNLVPYPMEFCPVGNG